METFADAFKAQTVYCDWEQPGAPVTIHVARAAVRTLLASGERRFGIFQSKVESGGVLLGRATRAGAGRVLTIDEAVEIPCEHLFGPEYLLSVQDREELAAAIERRSVVGLYRTHGRKTAATLTGDDRAFVDEMFPDDGQCALLIERRLFGKPKAAVFVREGGELPFISTVEVPISIRSTNKFLSQTRILAWYSAWVQLPLFLMLFFFVGLLGFLCARQVHKQIVPAAETRDPYAISLVILEYGQNLHLTWDRDALPVRAGQRGALTITDGGESRSIDLTAAQLREASVTYRRLGGRVRFRLEVFLPRRRSVSEMWESPEIKPEALRAE